MFCEVCLNEYTLFVDQCSVCDKKINKKRRPVWCRLIDDAIEKLLKHGNLISQEKFEKWIEKCDWDNWIIESSKLDSWTIQFD